MPTSPRALLAALGLLAAGCPSALPTEGGQLEVTLDGARAGALGSYSVDSPLLVGAAYCPTLTCALDCPEEGVAVDDCFYLRVLGAGSLDADGCALVEQSGELEWWFEAVSCPANAVGYAPVDDYLHLQAVGLTGVSAQLEQWPERNAETSLEPAGLSWPSGWTAAAGEPLAVLAGATLRLPIVLRHADSDHEVLWMPADASLALEQTGSGEVLMAEPEPGVVALTAPSGSAATLTMTLMGEQFELARVEAVDADDVRSLQIVAGYLPSETGGGRAPFGARAVLWADDGRAVLGAEVAWSVRRGSLAVTGMEELPGPDYVALDDSCYGPDEPLERSAQLRASWDGRRDNQDLSWTADAQDTDADWAPSPDCLEGGCGCQGAGGLRATLGAAALALSALLLRRRPARAQGASGARRQRA